VSERMKSLERKPDARNGHVRFDERGVETKRMARYSDTGNRKGRTQLRPAFTPPRHSSTLQRISMNFKSSALRKSGVAEISVLTLSPRPQQLVLFDVIDDRIVHQNDISIKMT
jgi:hypothetical protein